LAHGDRGRPLSRPAAQAPTGRRGRCRHPPGYGRPRRRLFAL